MFKRTVEETPNEPFLGTRPVLAERDAQGKTQYGAYVWKTFAEVNELASNFAHGMENLQLCPKVEAEGKTWRFIGVWAKNCWEWTNTLLASMHIQVTTVGFYDAQSQEQVDFIIKQTELKTVVCTENYANRLVKMRSLGMVPNVKTLVLMESPSPQFV